MDAHLIWNEIQRITTIDKALVDLPPIYQSDQNSYLSFIPLYYDHQNDTQQLSTTPCSIHFPSPITPSSLS